MKNKTLIIIGVVAIILIIGLVTVVAYLFGQQRAMIGDSIQKQSQESDVDEGQIAVCTMDAKICPDGSAVSRSGVDCKFEDCPAIDAVAKNNKQDDSELKSIDNLWSQYTNHKQGFAIKLPKKTNSYEGVEYKPTIIEDEDLTYLISSDYNLREVKKVRKSGKSAFEKASSGISYAILIQPASSNEELEAFIQKRYDKTCNLDGIKETNTKGVFDVLFSGEDNDDNDARPPINCFINYGTVVKYSPSKGLVAAWDIGQEPQFVWDSKNIVNGVIKSVIDDEKIADSFEFLK